MELVPFRRSWPWGPSRTSEDLPARREMEDFLDRFFGGRSLPAWAGEAWAPSVDVSETDGQITVKAELPGMDGKDIDINVSGDLLILKGEKKEEKEEKEGQFYYRERYAGSFQRSVRLPTEVLADRADAELKNGVLQIVLPKAQETRSSKIEVRGG